MLYLLKDEKQKIKLFVFFLLSFVLGVLLTGYYILPLFGEIKYFYYGDGSNRLVPNQYLSFVNYLSPNWYYYYNNDIFVRGNFIKFGIVETTIIVISIGYAIYQYIKKKKVDGFLITSIITAVILIFFTMSLSNILYTKIKLLGGIQFPWRMLSGLIFIPGILIAYLIDKVHKYKQVIIFFLVVVIAFFQFPQLYGKNYALYPQSNYFFTRTNLHGEILNTIWTGKTEDYPVEKNKIAIISGKGTITNEIVKNSLREYDLNASTPIRIADYTFYFPGWHVFANGVDTTIQFQDPKYRGVITYELPAGDYHIQDIFKNTKIRTLGDIITVIVGVLVLLFFIAEIKFSCLQKQLFR